MKIFIKALLIILGIGVLLTMISMIFLPEFRIMSNIIQRNEAYGDVIEFVEENEMTALTFDLKNRHINLNYVDEDYLTVRYYQRDKENFEFNVLNQNLIVSHTYEQIWSRIFVFNFVAKQYLTVEVDIPNSWQLATLDLKTETGDIRLTHEHVKTYDEIDINNATGSVYLSNIICDNLTVSTSTGDINLEEIVVNNLSKITLSTGKTSLKHFISDQTQIKTSTGDIIVDDLTTNDLEIDSSTGKVELSNSEIGTLDIDISTGRIIVQYVTANAYQLKTSTGDIQVKLETMNDLKLNLKADTGKVRVDGLSQGNQYQTQDGSIIFNARTSTGNITIEVDA